MEMAFDGLVFARKLEKAGFNREQAEAFAEAQAENARQQSETTRTFLEEFAEDTLEELATRNDVRETELRLQKEIELVRKDVEVVRGEIRETELRLQARISETELRLQKEIELVRKDIESVRKDVESVRGEIRETELRLQKEIEIVRGEIRETELRLQKEIEIVRGEIRSSENKLLKWQFGIAATIIITLATMMAKGFNWLGF